uniref:Uncharacterized protein n=1 Tax=Anguilla anguilla TaxID=7936 RepID=A0A0E9PIW0_ANGAN
MKTILSPHFRHCGYRGSHQTSPSFFIIFLIDFDSPPGLCLHPQHHGFTAVFEQEAPQHAENFSELLVYYSPIQNLYVFGEEVLLHFHVKVSESGVQLDAQTPRLALYERATVQGHASVGARDSDCGEGLVIGYS